MRTRSTTSGPSTTEGQGARRELVFIDREMKYSRFAVFRGRRILQLGPGITLLRRFASTYQSCR
jgi:hypothetical protein